jgi:hypothetical protein
VPAANLWLTLPLVAALLLGRLRSWIVARIRWVQRCLARVLCRRSFLLMHDAFAEAIFKAAVFT